MGFGALRAEANHIDQAIHAGDIAQQVITVTRLGLNTIQHEDIGSLLALGETTLRIGQAGQLALILGFILGACGEAARRVGQWQMAIGKEFHLELIADLPFFACIQQLL